MRARTYVEGLLKAALRELDLPWPDKATVGPPRDKGHGDLASNVALLLAGAAKRKPRDLAEEIRGRMLAAAPDVESVEVAGPGFLNVTLTPAFWQGTVAEVLGAGERYGAVDVGQGRKVQVEFVSANPTGPLHIGHGRGAAVGDSLARVLRFTGHDVQTEYYINDAGLQMNLLGASTLARLRQLLGHDTPLPEDGYKGEYLLDVAREVLERAGGDGARFAPTGDEAAEAETLAFWQQVAMDSILDGIKVDLRDFGVTHEVWFSEKTLVASGAVERALEMLAASGMSYEADGALWFKSTFLGDDKDRVLRTSDGRLTYLASDVAYHADKYRRGFDLVVDIWGADHHGYVPRMKAAVQALGRSADDLGVILVQLVNLLRGGEQVAMSTRAGEFVTLAEVVAEVGADSARFIFLSRKSDSHLDFDLDLVKRQSMDNPVYYVQYGHARISSVQRKAVEEGVLPSAVDSTYWREAVLLDDLGGLSTTEDIILLRLLDRFPDEVAQAAASLSPHNVSYYVQELAGALHRYYTMHQVLAAGEASLVRARLLLLAAVAQVLRNGFGLLGVSAPERM